MAGPNSPSPNLTRREALENILKTGVVAMGLEATVAKGAPASDGVRQSTKDAVAALRKEFPEFKLSPEAQECIDDSIKGKSVDPECDPAINAEVRLHKKTQEVDQMRREVNAKEQQVNAKEQQVNAKEQQVNAKEQQVNAKEQQNTIMKSIRVHMTIVLGLVQLGLYIDRGTLPPDGSDQMSAVMKNPDTPGDVRSLFEEFLRRKKDGSIFTWKDDGKRLIALANRHLDIARDTQTQLTDTTFRQQASAMYSQVYSSYNMTVQILTKKS